MNSNHTKALYLCENKLKNPGNSKPSKITGFYYSYYPHGKSVYLVFFLKVSYELRCSVECSASCLFSCFALQQSSTKTFRFQFKKTEAAKAVK